MTREEAKRRLLNIERSIPNTFRTKEDVRNFEALEMAIKALEQEPCSDAISRQAVLEYIEGSGAELGHGSENELVCQDIKELPPVIPQPKTGHWIYICNKVINHSIKIVECDKCHNRTYGSGKYCPNCGARMVEPKAESEEVNE